MSASIVKRGDGRYAVVVEEGMQLARRCTSCRTKHWVKDHPTETCSKCASPLGPPGEERRQRWHSGFRTLKDAKATQARLAVSVTDQIYVGPAKTTFAQYLTETWLPSLPARIKASTLASYRTNINSHVIPHLGAETLQTLTPDKLDRFYAALLATGLKPKTVRNVHVIVRKALQDALRSGRVARNVAEAANPPARSATRAPEMKSWTPDQLRTFLELARDHRLYAAFVVAGTTGMRRGEVLGLKWADVDLDGKTVTIRRSLVTVDYAIRFEEPKTASGKRTIAIDDGTAAALRQHRKRQKEERIALGAGYKDQDLVFSRIDGAPLHPDLFSQTFDRLVARSGLPRIRLHDLRHSHVAHLIEAGVHVGVISKRIGHASAGFTLDQYGHLIGGLDAAAAKAVSSNILRYNEVGRHG